MTRFMPLCLALLATLWAGDVSAQDWDPIPELPAGERAAVKPSLDGTRFDELRECLADYRSSVGAEYYAVVVDVTNKFGRPTPRVHHTVEFVDAAYQAYKPTGRLDPEKHVLVALGIENRGVAIHPGTDWVHLGFETGAIKRTIDGSEFPTYARSGDYARAVCALVGAIDSQLRDLKRDQQRRKGMLADRIDEARARTDEVVESARNAAGPDAIMTHEIESQMPRVKHIVEDAQRALARGWISKTAKSVSAAEQQLTTMADRIRDFRAARTRLTELAERADALEETIEDRPDRDWSGPQEAKQQLQACQSDVDNALDTLETGKIPDLASYEAADCLGRVESTLQTANAVYVFTTFYLPIIVGVVLLFLIVVFIVGRLRRHRELDRKLAGVLDEWSRKLARASERLMELESEYPFYFDSSRPPWEANSAELDQDCANAINRAFLLYSEANTLHEDASALIADTGALSVAPLERAWNMLHSREITFSTGEVEQRRRIFLPLTREYHGTAAAMLDDLADAYREASRLLDSVSNLVSDLDESTSRCSREVERIERAAQTRDELGYPSEHLHEASAPLVDEHHALVELAKTDPISALSARRDLATKLGRQADRAELGNQCIERLEGNLLERAREAAADVERLRADGYAVQEPGFDPDRTLERLRREARHALDLVRDGREDDAGALTDAIAANLSQLETELDTTEAARAQVPKDLNRLEEQREGLESRLPGARSVLETLESEHARQAYATESDNLTELANVLERLEAWESSIAKAHEAQHYLSATADLETGFEHVAKGDHLLTAIHEAKARLEKARRDASEMRTRIESLLEQMRPCVDGDREGISSENRERFDAIEARSTHVFSEMQSDRPNWLELRDDTAELESLAESQLGRMERDLEDFEAAAALYQQLASDHDDLAFKVRHETRDRAFVQDAVDKVRSQLDAWHEQLELASGGGTALLRHGKSLQKSLAWARSVWTSELALIKQVEAKQKTVENRIAREHNRSLGYGVHVDCSDARQAVNDAETAMNARDHERALSLLQNAHHRVETELDMAQHRYDSERQEALARRRRNRRSSSSSYSSSSSFSSSSSSFGSSFSGGSSFSSSSSGGSSFGGTSSGGSSW